MQLFPYQQTGAEWLAKRRHALLGDKMGLGKTVQAIEAANLTGARRVAVVCPAIARVNWQREIDKWALYSPAVKIESYNKLALDRALRQDWARWKPDVLIIDEAHYLKTKDASRTKALYGPHCRGDGLVACAGATWRLSGTLTPNNASELFPHLRASFPDVLPGTGSFADFINRYTVWEPGDHGPKILANKNLAELRQALGPHLLRRRTEDVLPDLPRVMMGELAVEADEALDELRALEETIEVQELVYRLDDTAATPDADPHIAAFRRVCGVAKAGPLAAIVADELRSDQYHKIVIFAHHRDVITRLMQDLAAFRPVRVWGGDSDAARQKAIDDFQGEPSVRVFVGQISACATAITLTAASQVLFVEQSWVPSDNEQAIYRLRRTGQKSQIFCRIGYLDKSIDEAVSRSLARKTKGLLELYGEIE